MSNLFKSFLLLFLFFGFLYGENSANQSVQSELNNIKVEIEKLKYIHNEDTQLKIIELENKIEKLEDKFINKDQLEKYNEIINRQDGRISDNFTRLEIGVAFFGVLVTVVVIIFSFRNSSIARAEANKELQEWLKENKEKILKPIQNEADKLLSEIQEQIDEFFKDAKEQLSKHDIQKELDNREKEILTKVTNSLKSKHEENYTYNDWYSLYLEEYYKEERVHKLRALEYIEKAINRANSDYDEIKARFDKAFLLTKIEKVEESIKEYNLILDKYLNCNDEKLDEYISMSLYNKGVRLRKKENYIDAIVSNEVLIDKYKNSSNLRILERVSRSFMSKAMCQVAINQIKEAIKTYSSLLNEFKDSNDESVIKNKNSALINRLELLIINDEDAEKELSILSDQFKNDKLLSLQVRLLEIFSNSRFEEQMKNIDQWMIDYEESELKEIWYFQELRTWAKTIEDIQVKERIGRYISIFEEKLEDNID